MPDLDIGDLAGVAAVDEEDAAIVPEVFAVFFAGLDAELRDETVNRTLQPRASPQSARVEAVRAGPGARPDRGRLIVLSMIERMLRILYSGPVLPYSEAGM
ncbi:MAG: hypothetical protein CL949_08935 [Erythrobacter sp.]|nr:hypothetical protein [Erythrobacter sp.]